MEKEEKSVSPEVLTGHESWTWSPAWATNSSTSAAKSFRQEVTVRDIKIVSNVVKINISSFVHSNQLLHLFKALLIPRKLFQPLCVKVSQIHLTKSVKAF